MMSGRQTLASIDSTLQQLRGQIAETEERIAGYATQKLKLQQEEIEQFRELGRLRLEVLTGDFTVPSASETDRTVKELLARRKDSLSRLQNEVKALEQRRLDLDRRREEQAALVEDAARAIDEAEKKTQERLQQEPEYQRQLQAVQDLERTLQHAQSKASRWEEELEIKGSSYRNDSLFMYLWNRGYGTTAYRGWGLTRWLDGKVAALIRYSEARINFSKLQEIPLRLREHAERIDEQAKEEHRSLEALDHAAREADGIIKLDDEFKRQEADLDEIDAQIEQVVAEQRALEQELATYATGNDQDYREAIDYLAGELNRDSLQELRRWALATPFPEDDLAVNRLLELEEKEDELETGLAEFKKMLAGQEKRLDELENLRADFKRRRYDSAGTGFSDSALILATLGNLFNGMMTRDAFWRVLEQQRRQQRHRANPDFGSGGFGRGSTWGSPMRFPKPSGGGFGGGRGGFRVPAGRSGGGFRTGGGF
jgi:chromosome segregation ATPase